MKRPLLAVVTAILMTWGVWQLGQGIWIYAKAELAQLLLQRAWQRTLRGEAEQKPWPWADTWPMARLQMSKYGVDLILLAGASGRTLAFGPGHVSSSALPGNPGTVIFSGHRDTHFNFLALVTPGDEMIIEVAKKQRHRYRVIRTDIVDSRKATIAASQEASLVLVTCYPFNTMVPGGPLRYIVTAERL
ncbi:MAG TPA: class GN sortase [Nitrospirales bacterium]|jgi:sortase A